MLRGSLGAVSAQLIFNFKVDCHAVQNFISEQSSNPCFGAGNFKVADFLTFCRPPLTGNGNPVDCRTIECREYRRPLVFIGKRGKVDKQSIVDCVNPIVSHPLIDPC